MEEVCLRTKKMMQTCYKLQTQGNEKEASQKNDDANRSKS